MSKLNIFDPLSDIPDLINPAIIFPYKSDNFQKYAYNAIDNNENVLVTAHTGSGKTNIGIYAIAKHLRLGHKIAYTAPIKTLSNQKYKEFVELFNVQFSAELGRTIQVGLLTGDNKINPSADIIILTAEILANSLYKLNVTKPINTTPDATPDILSTFNLDDIKCVVMDEVHYISSDRGKVWEETIILLDASVQLIMLSATMNKPDIFAKWVADIKCKPISLIPTSHRVVPLNHYIYLENNKYEILNNDNKFDAVMYDIIAAKYKTYISKLKTRNQMKVGMFNEFMKYIKKEQLQQIIFFSFSRKNCEKLANLVQENFLDFTERTESEKIFYKYIKPYKEKYEKLPQYQLLFNLLQKGIAFHHSGVVPILKEIVEILFSKGLIKLLFATETFSVGINMPTRSVVFTNLDKPTSTIKRYLNTAEYRQMCGRAGRRGIDRFGNIIFLPIYDLPDRTTFQSVMCGPIPPIISKFDINYQFIIKIIQSKSYTSDKFIKNSLYNIENEKSIQTTIMAYNTSNASLIELDSELTLLNISKSNYKEYYDLNEKNNILIKSGFIPNKADMKLLAKLKSTIINNHTIYKWDKYVAYMNAINNNNELKNNIEQNKTYINTIMKNYLNVLNHFNYLSFDINNTIDINNLTNNNVLLKGIIAANINECNPFIITELITNNMLDGLTCPEIIGLMAIFIDDKLYNETCTIDQLNISTNMKNTLYYINDIIDKYNHVESNNNITPIQNISFWNINYDFIECTYIWASLGTFADILNIVTIYEGNFIRNMLKINNIITDIMSLSILANKIHMLPTLELSEKLIIRDIVTINSLYLS